MASPQKENGYAPIANEILEALSRVPSLGSEAFQVLMFVLRFCYGFQRKEAELSLTFIAKGTGMKKRNVSRGIERLVSKRMVVRSKSATTFNKNYDQWVVSKRTGSVQSDRGVVSKRMEKVVSNRTLKKDNVKDNLNKDNVVQLGTGSENPINKVFQVFYRTVNPQINFGQKSWRGAAAELIKAYGEEEILKLTEVACSIQGLQYAPTITNPYELKTKLASLQIFIKKSQTQKGSIQTL